MSFNCNKCTRLCTIFTRVVAVAYSILAFFTFLEARDLARAEGYHYDSEKAIVYVPLLLCAPPSIDEDGSSLEISADSSCRGMSYLISAPFVCSACSALACIFFVIMDILARYEKGPFSMSAVAGMGLYLVVILVQSGISTGALVEQNIYWVNNFQEYLDDQELDFTAKSYANTTILVSATGVAFATAFFILIDAILYRCNEKRQASLEEQRIADFVKASREQMEAGNSNSVGATYDIPQSSTMDTTTDDLENKNDADVSRAESPSWITAV